MTNNHLYWTQYTSYKWKRKKSFFCYFDNKCISLYRLRIMDINSECIPHKRFPIPSVALHFASSCLYMSTKSWVSWSATATVTLSHDAHAIKLAIQPQFVTRGCKDIYYCCRDCNCQWWCYIFVLGRGATAVFANIVVACYYYKYICMYVYVCAGCRWLDESQQ